MIDKPFCFLNNKTMKHIRRIPNVLIDICLFVLSLYITIKLRAVSPLLIFTRALDYSFTLPQLIVILSALPPYIISLYITGIYEEHINISSVQIFFRSLLSAVVVFYWILMILYAFEVKIIPRSLILVHLLTNSVLFLLYKSWRIGQLKKADYRIVIVGDPSRNGKFLESLGKFKSFRIIVEGLVTPEKGGGSYGGHKVLGDYADLNSIITDYAIDAVFIASDSSEEKERLLRSIQYGIYADTRIYATPTNYEILLSAPQYIRIGDIPLIRINKSTQNLFFIKRGFDLTASFLLILLLLPLMGLVALLVIATSRGPAIFRQHRVGKGQRLFTIYKFRTMHTEFESKVYQAQGKGDKRITPIGGILRKTRLDELPQLYNIIKGDMSFIGPRPLVEKEVQEGLDTNFWYKERFSILPGITGLAQVHGDYYTEAEEKLKYDLWYVFHYTPFLDVTIILRTIKIIFLRSGS